MAFLYSLFPFPPLSIRSPLASTPEIDLARFVAYSHLCSPHIGVAIGNFVLDLNVLSHHHLFPGPILHSSHALHQHTLNQFMALGKAAWNECRETVQRLLSAEEPQLRDNQALRAEVCLS